jgi:outer membrane protein assembly factor BamB
MRPQQIRLFPIPVLLASLLLATSIHAEPTNAIDKIWRLRIPGYTFVTECSCAVAPDGTIYQGTFDGKLLAISPDGDIKWTFKAGLEIWSSPAIAGDGTIYFGSRDRNLYALTPDGKLKWKFATGAWVDSSPAIAGDGTIYFGSWDKKIYALTTDGKLKWQFATGNLINSSPALAADGTIYFGSHDKKFYALAPDGKLKWAFATGGEIEASPAIAADGTIYIGSTDGNLYALHSDGSEFWRLHTGSYTASSPVLDENGNLYFAANTCHVSVSPQGKLRSSHETLVPMDLSPIVTSNGRIYMDNPWLHLGIGYPDGNEEWGFAMSFNLSSSPNMDPSGIIYACDGSYLYALKPAAAAPPAKSSWPMWRANPQHTGRVQKID